MKYSIILILSVITVISCKQKKNEPIKLSPNSKITITDAVFSAPMDSSVIGGSSDYGSGKIKKDRYFLYSYRIEDQNHAITGNALSSGGDEVPIIDSLQKYVYDNYRCRGYKWVNQDDIIILSLFEYKDSIEAAKSFGPGSFTFKKCN